MLYDKWQTILTAENRKTQSLTKENKYSMNWQGLPSPWTNSTEAHSLVCFLLKIPGSFGGDKTTGKITNMASNEVSKTEVQRKTKS